MLEARFGAALGGGVKPVTMMRRGVPWARRMDIIEAIVRGCEMWVLTEVAGPDGDGRRRENSIGAEGKAQKLACGMEKAEGHWDLDPVRARGET